MPTFLMLNVDLVRKDVFIRVSGISIKDRLHYTQHEGKCLGSRTCPLKKNRYLWSTIVRVSAIEGYPLPEIPIHAISHLNIRIRVRQRLSQDVET